jgi:cell division initiation protein
MDLTPNDIRNYEFSTQLRGYDKDAVDEFMEQAASALEQSKQESLKLSMEIEALKNQIMGLKQFEDTIKNAAIDARRNADMLLQSAKKEAEEILSKAIEQSQQTIAARAQQLAELEEQVGHLSLTRRSYLSKLREIIGSHMELIEEIERAELTSELAQKLEENVEVTESSEVTVKSREMMASKPSEQEESTSEDDSVDIVEGPEVQSKPAEDHAPPPTDVTEQPSETKPKDSVDDEKTEVIRPVPEESDESSAEQSMDPELAAALEQYKRQASQRQQAPQDMDFGPAPKPNEVVETTARAEDIPPGFIAKRDHDDIGEMPEPEDSVDSEDEYDEEIGQETGRIGLAPEAQEHPTEHNVINVDNGEEHHYLPKRPGVDDLDKSLDEIAAKFDETADKASKK